MLMNLEIERARVNQNTWKLALTKQILNLEHNLEQLYTVVGLKYNHIVSDEPSIEGSIKDDYNDLNKHEYESYVTIIHGFLSEVELCAATTIALLHSDTDFDLPVPVFVLLKLASKIGFIRWLDFSKKIPGSPAKRYVYEKTSLVLIQISLNLIKNIAIALDTDILPFQTYINDNIMNLLLWTRTSDLESYDKQKFFSIRSLAIGNLNQDVARHAININLNADKLRLLTEVELMVEITRNLLDDEAGKYVCDLLACLDLIYINYARLLDTESLLKLKSFVVHTCLDMYRNYEKCLISPICRRYLLNLLVSMANNPVASSTTELAWSIFELAIRLETDAETVLYLRKIMHLGLAHRPVILTSVDNKLYYNVGMNDSTKSNEKEDVRAIKNSENPMSNVDNNEAGRSEQDKTIELTQCNDVELFEENNIESALDKEVGVANKNTAIVEDQTALSTEDPILSLFVDKPAV